MQRAVEDTCFIVLHGSAFAHVRAHNDRAVLSGASDNKGTYVSE